MRVIFAIVLLLISSVARGESWTPSSDYDGGAVNNNSFNRAGSLGSLTQPDNNTPNDKKEPGWLGVVAAGKFDTVDYYRFNIPANQWLVHFQLVETPKTSMWLNIYDANGAVIWPSRGADEEDFIIALDAGDYFLAVMTNQGVANGRVLKYELSIRPALVPHTDNAGPSCRNAPLLDGRQHSIAINGSLDSTQPTDAYLLFLPGEARMWAARLGRHYRLRMLDPSGPYSFLLQDGPTDNLKATLYDPGYYCFYIENSTVSGPANYSVTINPDLGILPPRDIKDDPWSSIPNFNKGPYKHNGQYGESRYVDRPDGINYADPTLVPSKIYNVTEWLPPGTSHQLLFDLPSAKTELNLRVLRTNALIRASVLNTSGDVVAVAKSDGMSLVNGFLPHQTLKVELPKGRYYLRVSQIGGTSIGTPYSIEMIGGAKQ